MLLAGLLVALLPAGSGAAPAAPRDRIVTGWLPGWAPQPGLTSIEAHADLFGEVSPFWFSARATGTTAAITTQVSAQTMAATLASLRARGIAVLPSIADASAPRAMSALLRDPVARGAHVAQLADLVIANGYDGLELDYEKFAFADGTASWPQTRPAWVAFVTELSAALRAQGKRLALAVPPMYDGSQSRTSGYWVYDYPAVAPAIDSLRIMTYDYSVSRPGPIAPLSFVRRALSYAVTVVPAARIRMGLPAYGRLWTARRANGRLAVTGRCPRGVPGRSSSFKTVTALEHLTAAAGRIPAVRFDPVSGESTATFTKRYKGKRNGKRVSCTVRHVAWWVDSRGVAARLPMVSEFGLAGVSIWHLSGVDPDSWAVLRDYSATADGR